MYYKLHVMILLKKKVILKCELAFFQTEVEKETKCLKF